MNHSHAPITRTLAAAVLLGLALEAAIAASPARADEGEGPVVSAFDDGLASSNEGEVVGLVGPQGPAVADGTGWTSDELFPDQDPGPGVDDSPVQEAGTSATWESRNRRAVAWGCGAVAEVSAFSTPMRSVVDARVALKVPNDASAVVDASVVATGAHMVRVYTRNQDLQGFWYAKGAVALPHGRAQVQGFHSYTLAGYVETELDVETVFARLEGKLEVERDEGAVAIANSGAEFWGVVSAVAGSEAFASMSAAQKALEVAAKFWTALGEAYAPLDPQDVTVEREFASLPVENFGNESTFRVKMGTAAGGSARGEATGSSWQPYVANEVGAARLVLVSANRHQVLLDGWSSAAPKDQDSVRSLLEGNVPDQDDPTLLQEVVDFLDASALESGRLLIFVSLELLVELLLGPSGSF